MNINDMPIIRRLHQTYTLGYPRSWEATPVHKGRGQQCPSSVEPMEVDFAEGGDKDGIAAPTNQNDNNYVAEEDDEKDDKKDSEEDKVDENKVKGKRGIATLVKARKKCKQGPKHATKNLKEDKGDDKDTRPKKKVKGITKGLVPEEKMKEGVEPKKKKVKPGVLLRDAIAALRLKAKEQNCIIDSATRGNT